MGKKICVVFPGIGYHTDKPLLYYSKKYMMAHGYDIVDVTYGKLSGHLPEEIQKVFDDGSLRLRSPCSMPIQMA